ncbi:MAG: HU family DNA-binding protein [Candidatus Pelagibacter sp.]
MAIVKSELIKQIKKSYPNFLNRDLSKLIDIILNEIKNSLKRSEGVELRGFGTFRTNIQKESIRRNPKTGTKVNVPKKRTIKWKMSKDLFKKLNNEKE